MSELVSLSFTLDVFYSCGACGYHLNLSSSQRLLPIVDRKALRKRRIAFFTIDVNRVKTLEEFVCAPYAHANGNVRFHKLRTRLLCGSCGKVIGHAHANCERFSEQADSSDFSSGSSTSGSSRSGSSLSSPGCGTSEHGKFCIRIKALQPVLDP